MKIYIAKRNYRSEPEAILRLSNHGVARVLEINENSIIEEFIDFEKRKLGLKRLGHLLNKIHSERNHLGISLVHGDFGEHNATLINNEPKCFDYEYAHFGNVYADIGRVVLRDCDSWEDFTYFFSCYTGKIPKPEEFREGLIYFCNWQSSLRADKKLQYSEVPLYRKSRLNKVNGKDLGKILEAFKSEVKLR